MNVPDLTLPDIQTFSVLIVLSLTLFVERGRGGGRFRGECLAKPQSCTRSSLLGIPCIPYTVGLYRLYYHNIAVYIYIEEPLAHRDDISSILDLDI
jgi:hypothetical protein